MVELVCLWLNVINKMVIVCLDFVTEIYPLVYVDKKTLKHLGLAVDISIAQDLESLGLILHERKCLLKFCVLPDQILLLLDK